ncbi:MAG: FkbM family methyltransferase [Kiritimatiellae bacterium]|nr:FkbM family methyltransferase [Kiritimatiellia bacterium]
MSEVSRTRAGMMKVAVGLRALVPRIIRRACHRVGFFLGADLDIEPQFVDMWRSLRLLAARGYKPHFCIDAGAYHGDWTRKFKALFPECAVLMVEAQGSKASRLAAVAAEYAKDVSLVAGLLGAEDGLRVVFAEMETGSSVYVENSNVSHRDTEMETHRLDSVLLEQHCPPVDFLKLDVQGYELEVLKGAPRCLAQTQFVLLEASLVAINRGCPLMAEVVAFMEAGGFKLYDVCGISRRSDGVLWQMDLLFVRADSQWLPCPELTVTK